MAQLLTKKPEGEARLLSALVNKLGELRWSDHWGAQDSHHSMIDLQAHTTDCLSERIGSGLCASRFVVLAVLCLCLRVPATGRFHVE
jgi:hypothetical protein